LNWSSEGESESVEQTGSPCSVTRFLACGTGSKPPGWKGWQRHTRSVASFTPCSVPWVAIASAAYSEQVGTKRQRGGNNGLTQRR